MQRITPRHYPALREEIRTWRDDGLIPESIAQVLDARYLSEGGGFKVAGALTIIGAVLVGLGAILFVGANWSSMTHMAKVILLLAAIACSYLFGWRFQYEPGNRPKLGTALNLLGSLLFGASIWLIGQIFNLDPSAKDGLLLWAIGLAPLVLITRSVPQGILFSIVSSAWMIMNDQTTFGLVASFGSVASMIAVSHFIRSRASLTVALVGAAIRSAELLNLAGLGLIAFGLTAFAGYLIYKDRWKLMADPYMYIGAISGLIGALTLTFENGGFHLHFGIGLSLILVCALAQVFLAVRNKEHMADAAVILALLAGSCGWMFLSGVPQLALGNAIFLMTIALLVFAGLNRYKRPALINIALVFFVIDIIARYFDFFFSMFDRSAFFLIGGIVLMIVGSIAERSRRSLIERIA